MALLTGVRDYFLFLTNEPSLIDLCILVLAVFLLSGNKGSYVLNFSIVTVELLIIIHKLSLNIIQ